MHIKKLRLNYDSVVYLGDNMEELARNIKKDFPKKSDHEIEGIVLSLKRKNDNIISSPNVYKVADKHKETLGVSLGDAKKGAMAILSGITDGYVDQEEINRRAIICTGCPNKNMTSGCRSCGAGKAITSFVNSVKKMFGKGFTIPNNLDQFYCKSCSCSLVPMLPSKMSAFRESPDKNKSRPAFCWVNKESINYNP